MAIGGLYRPETPSRRRFDVAAYYRMAETGILSSRDRIELIDGVIVEMAPAARRRAPEAVLIIF